MLLMLLALAILWFATLVVVVSLCIAASRADREQLRAVRIARPSLRPVS